MMPRRHRAAVEVAPAPDLISDESERLAALVRLARAKIEAFASDDVNIEGCWNCRLIFSRRLTKVVLTDGGGCEGLGFCLKILDYGEADGSVSGRDVERFNREIAATIQDFATGIINYSVVLALMLTVFVALACLHVAIVPYESTVSTLNLDSNVGYTDAAGDTADLLWPDNAAHLRWVFYVCECVFVMYGTLIALVGLGSALMLYNSLTMHIPNACAKCEYLIARLNKFVAVGHATVKCMFDLCFTLTCVMARASAVAFLCAACMTVLFLVAFFSGTATGATDILRVQQHEARLLLNRKRRPARAEARELEP